MELKSIKLKDCIFEVDTRNTNLEVNNLLGVTINKVFIPSVANINGTDLSKYKIVNKNQFVCGLMQVSRDEGVAMALYKNDNKAIVSPAYYVFEVFSDIVIPEYLELIFCSSEFDREATFNAVGGVRGTLTWEDFCNIEISIPSLDEQKKFVNRYNTIVNRIDVLERLNEKLHNVANLIFQNTFEANMDTVENWELKTVGELIDIQNGLAYEAEYLSDCNSDTMLVSMSNAQLNTLFYNNKIKYYKIPVDETYMATAGDLFFPTRDLTQACNILSCPAIIPSIYTRNIIIGTNCYKVINYKMPKYNKYFLYLLFNSKKYREHIKGVANGSAILMIKKEHILDFSFHLPQEDTIVDSFNKKIEPIFSQLDTNYSEIIYLQRLKKLLTQKLT